MPTNATKGVKTSRSIEPELINIPVISRILNIDSRTVLDLMDKRLITWVQVGAQRRTSRNELMKFLNPEYKPIQDKCKEITLAVSEMCQILDLDRRSVNMLIKEKAFTTYKFGSHVRTSHAILSNYIDMCMTGKTKSKFIIFPVDLKYVPGNGITLPKKGKKIA